MELDTRAKVTPNRRLGWGIAEIAEVTGLSPAFLRNELRAGRLPFQKFGRRVLVLDEDLHGYLAKGSSGNKAREVSNEFDGDSHPS